MESSQPSGPALSQALWAIAALGLGNPGKVWMEVWGLRARHGLHTFTPQCLAHSVWALSELCGPPEEPPEAEVLEALLLKCGHELPSMSCMELTTLVASLAQLQYRPSDAWLGAYADHMRERLPDLQNQDFGQLLWGLATLAAPVEQSWLEALVRQAGKKWWSMDLESMALLLWGLAQYGYQPDKRDWWTGFWRESDLRWEGASPRTLGLLLVALAQLLDAPPSK